MRVAALLLALAAATSWGIGGVLLKRGLAGFSPTTMLIFQYVLATAVVGSWIALSGGLGEALGSVDRRWPALIAISVFQTAGYLFFIVAVKYAGEGSLPTAAAVAIAASYPVLIAVLSGPFLDEALGWNHVAGIALVTGGIIVSQL